MAVVVGATYALVQAALRWSARRFYRSALSATPGAEQLHEIQEDSGGQGSQQMLDGKNEAAQPEQQVHVATFRPDDAPGN